DSGTTGPGSTVPPPVPAVQLQDLVVPNLPSPFYHFDYDSAGRISHASFASGFTSYDVVYANGRISALLNNAVGNQDKLAYSYDQSGRAVEIDYSHPNGVTYVMVALSYDGARLTRLDRRRLIGADFVLEKTMSFSYGPNGNLAEIMVHRPAISGTQDETTTFDRFSQYDENVNVDSFSLIHDEFFDHLILLPGVQLQKGNPAKETFTGDGQNYTWDYSYVYDAKNRPIAKNGVLRYTNGPDAGKTFQTQTVFSYY
ncbi:MAG TPA: hypothetical protein VI259_26400, partial [Gemmatimonadaceae bacterium]